ncbi:MAG TPA: glycosyltransferase family 1 protein [Patescibacteria group bacterium]|nr:glycosyltransferase family 1 protein [Patescibacteria group bacterium]
MNIAIDITPIGKNSASGHKVRGVGFYIQRLQNALLKYSPENEYIFIDNIKKSLQNSSLQPPASNIDVLHIPYFDPFFLHLPRKKRFPTVLTIHDLTPLVFPQHFPAGIKGNIKWHIQKMMAKKCDAFITDSNASKFDVIRLLGIPEKKVHSVYLAADEVFVKKEMLIKTREAFLTKYGIPPQFVLYVGDVTWNKNVPRIVKAAIKAKVPLVMAGKALLEQDYDNKNSWNADLNEVNELLQESHKVFRLGFVPTEDLVLLYNLATCLLMPSLYEGFGLPILEAMQCGCPVITTRCGSLQEVAGDACIYVEPEDEDHIASAIRNVIENKSLQKELSYKGFKQAEKFTWKKTAEQTVKVYHELQFA